MNVMAPIMSGVCQRTLVVLVAAAVGGAAAPVTGETRAAGTLPEVTTITFEYELVAAANFPVPMELAESLVAPGLALCIYPCLNVEGALEGSGVESATALVQTILYRAAEADGVTFDSGVVGVAALWATAEDIEAPTSAQFQFQPVNVAAPPGVADVLASWGFPVTELEGHLDVTGGPGAWLVDAGLSDGMHGLSWTTAAAFPPLGTSTGREYVYWAGDAEELRGAAIWTEHSGNHAANHVVTLRGSVAPFGDVTGPADAAVVWYGQGPEIMATPNPWRYVPL